MCVCGGVGDEEGGPGQWPYIHPQGPVPIHLPSGASAFTFTLRGQCPYIHPQGPVPIHPPSGASAHTSTLGPVPIQARGLRAHTRGLAHLGSRQGCVEGGGQPQGSGHI